MPDILCPMCGKLNQSDETICQYCQARLKPIEMGNSVTSSDSQEEVPDWLARLRQYRSEEQEASERANEWLEITKLTDTASEEDTPDWIRKIAAESSKEPVAPEKDSNWLEQPRSPESSSELQEKKPTGVPGETQTGETGDFNNALDEKENLRPSESKEDEADAVDRIIDRLSALRKSDEDTQEPVEKQLEEQALTRPDEAVSGDEEEVPEWPDIFSGEEPETETVGPEGKETPDWMSDILTQAPEPGIEKVFTDERHAKEFAAVDDVEVSVSPSPFIGADLPEWLADLSSQESTSEAISKQQDMKSDRAITSQPPAEADTLFPGKGLTAQIPSATMSDEDEESEEHEELESLELKPAQIPSWLHAMRPLEAVAPESANLFNEQQVIESGPLAGMKGVLPAVDIKGQYHKPPIYAAKLNVTEKQFIHSTVLDDLVTAEVKPQTSRRKRIEKPKRIIGLLIGLFLIIVLLIPMLFDLPDIFPYTYHQPEEVLIIYDQVESLSLNKPVLLAVDFNAGFSGEMRFASEGILEQFMDKNIPLATISTVPAGPILAEELLRTVLNNRNIGNQSMNTTYTLDESVVNLGYLAGGITSLQEFALHPQQATGYGLAWEHQVLQSVSSIADFAMLIVLTDSMETGRAWIEQVQPILGDVPCILVTSSQAAPMLQPYRAAGQVQGMISGISGGMAYDRLLQRNSNHAFWISYQYGLIMALVVIVLGILYRILSPLLSRSDIQNEA